MVELLVVLAIIALLIALLIPAVNGAIKAARAAAVQAEINQLAQALADFKSKFGDYPPSRIILDEGGYMQVGLTGVASPTATSDVTLGQLYQRTMTAFRKFWPRVTLSTAGEVYPAKSTVWYDFNGNATNNSGTALILQGHECLCFFLGGVPNASGGVVTGMTGWSKTPTNPFTNSANRNPPLFEFDAGRLVTNPSTGMPGYLDSLTSSTVSPPQNFYTYFSTNNGAGYDPNDVNFEKSPSTGSVTYVGQLYVAESDSNNVQPIGLTFGVSFPVYAGGTQGTSSQSPSPNPYTSGASFTSGNAFGGAPAPITYINNQSFQIISPGVDGLYGLGGTYSSSGAGGALPAQLGTNSKDAAVRVMEKDNLTNFHNGKLE
jgi:general secretion pathway protein G